MKKLVLLSVFMILLFIISACDYGYKQPEGYAKLYFHNNGTDWIAYVKEDGPIIDRYDYKGEMIYVYYVYDDVNNLFALANKEEIQVYILEGNTWYVKATDIKYIKIGDKT
jgi:hypothetical protein